jgi:phospholipid/cholesterol/gamma-HCH transport system substrate-binding protein
MVTQSPPRAAILVAVIFILASISLSFFVWSSLGGGLPMSPEGYRFHVTFENASQLQTNASVRIAGVEVGKVVKVEPEGLRTDATIELDSRYAPVRTDVRATLRQKTLLGETFVALSTGSREAPMLPEDGRLAVENVEPTQPLDRVLGLLDPETQDDFRSVLLQAADATEGRGDDFNAALGELGPLANDLDVLTEILDRQRASVGGLIRDAGVVLRTVGAHESGLAELVAAGREVASVTAERDAAVTDAVEALGPFLETLEGASRAVQTTAGAAGPTLRALRPVAPLVQPALASLQRLSPQVRAVLKELDSTLPLAEEALPATAHMVRELIPFVKIVYPTTREITPLIELMTSYRRELIATMANVGSALQATAPGTDGKDVHYLRALVPVTEEAFVGYAQRNASNRHNAYFAPGGLERLSDGGLLASDCRNTANPQAVPVIGSGAPVCRQQPPWTFGGETAYFPHVERVPEE